MSDNSHEAVGHLPPYITAPGETDTLYVIVVLFVVIGILAIGVLYLKLHSIPEKMAHSSNHTQFQLVAVLALIALFTHNNVFWILALLLATVQLPDYEGLLKSISSSLERMADHVTPATSAEPQMAQASAASASEAHTPSAPSATDVAAETKSPKTEG